MAVKNKIHANRNFKARISNLTNYINFTSYLNELSMYVQKLRQLTNDLLTHSFNASID